MADPMAIHARVRQRGGARAGGGGARRLGRRRRPERGSRPRFRAETSPTCSWERREFKRVLARVEKGDGRGGRPWGRTAGGRPSGGGATVGRKQKEGRGWDPYGG
jgi:hypothetical protein